MVHRHRTMAWRDALPGRTRSAATRTRTLPMLKTLRRRAVPDAPPPRRHWAPAARRGTESVRWTRPTTGPGAAPSIPSPPAIDQEATMRTRMRRWRRGGGGHVAPMPPSRPMPRVPAVPAPSPWSPGPRCSGLQRDVEPKVSRYNFSGDREAASGMSPRRISALHASKSSTGHSTPLGLPAASWVGGMQLPCAVRWRAPCSPPQPVGSPFTASHRPQHPWPSLW